MRKKKHSSSRPLVSVTVAAIPWCVRVLCAFGLSTEDGFLSTKIPPEDPFEQKRRDIGTVYGCDFGR